MCDRFSVTGKLTRIRGVICTCILAHLCNLYCDFFFRSVVSLAVVNHVLGLARERKSDRLGECIGFLNR